jgi:outer membrane lipoprotein-sorting protein
MRKLLSALVVLLAVSAVAQNTSPAPTENENAKKARAVLNAMIDALGGQAYLNVQDMQQEGRTYSFYNGKPNSLGTLFWRSWKFPDKDRTELTKQRDVVYIFNGDKGYEVSYKGTAAAEPESLRHYLRRRNHSLETVLRIWLPDPKTALFYDGAAVAEQKPCDSVTLMNAKNDAVTIYLDSNTHLPVKKTVHRRDPADRLKNEEGEIYDNFRMVQGVLTPHTLLRTKNGDTTNQRFITTVKYNVGLPDSLFEATVTYDPYKHSGPRQ